MPDFPIDPIIPALKSALETHGSALLSAPPGSGKTTRVPLALLDFPGKILVLEPRRLAARSAARYMAAQLGEETGRTVGYRVRLENRVSGRTRVELLTEGILTRRLLADPELNGVSCVIFDEFHERGLQGDLGLALCLEARAALRPDLRLLVMSATLNPEPLRALLGNCPLLSAEGRVWPVEVRYFGQLAVNAADHPNDVARKAGIAVRHALGGDNGSILAFLPGAGEIRRTAEELDVLPPDVSVHRLYGDLPVREQDAAIAPAAPGKRKVVLATSIAETSLTIEGVRIVIDCGLARTMRFDPATGMERLITERVSQSGADQRAGRAGRIEPGVCIRLWRRSETLQAHPRPEIMEADLAAMLLDILAWGAQPRDLAWLTQPPQNALARSAQVLLGLGAAEETPSGAGVVKLQATPHGLKLSRLPLHPRLAHMVVSAGSASSLAACLAAIVSERDPLRGGTGLDAGADIRARLPLLARKEHAGLRGAAEQIHRLSGLPGIFRLPGPEQEDLSGFLLSLAWPERIAQRRGRGSFRLASGQGAEISPEDPLADSPFLAVSSLAVPGGPQGLDGGNMKIFLAAPLAESDLIELHGKRVRRENELRWDNREQAVICRESLMLDALVLEEKPLPPGAQPEDGIKKAVLEGIRDLGLGCLPWTEESRQWQGRVMLLRGLDDPDKYPWPDVNDAALSAALEEAPQSGRNWLAPWLGGIARRSGFASIDLSAALAALLPWPLPLRLEAEAPARIKVPSGSFIRIDYTQESGPVLAVKIQEMFGQSVTPAVASGRVPLKLHLLSPAGRPLQITRDLEHFWASGYQAVRSEMRGRYPKHPWPEDPLAAIPTRKAKNRPPYSNSRLR